MTIGAKVEATEGSDLFGSILGLSLLVLPIWWIRQFGSTIWTDPLCPFRGSDLAGTSLTAVAALLAACLFVPARHYEKGSIRRIGSIALAMSIAAAACCPVISAYGAIGYLSHRESGFAWIGILLAIAAAIGCVHLLSAACVMLFKLRPRPAHRGIWVTASSFLGLVGGGLPLAMLGLLFTLGRTHGIHSAHDAVSVWVPFIGAGFLIGAIPGSALGAWLVRRAVGQRGSFWKALLGALLGSVVPLIGTVIGAVIGSGWRVKIEGQS